MQVAPEQETVEDAGIPSSQGRINTAVEQQDGTSSSDRLGDSQPASLWPILVVMFGYMFAIGISLPVKKIQGGGKIYGTGFG